MKRITKNLLIYWRYLGGILLLFCIQLYSITGVSDAIYGMRSTGAQKSGIEYIVSEALTAGAWKNVELYMSDSEKAEWSNCYTKAEDGFYYLNDAMKGESSLSALEQKFLVPQAIVWKLLQMDDEELDEWMGEDDSPFVADYMAIRDWMEGQLEAEGEQAIQDYALAFVREQSRIAGVDLQEKTARYIWGAAFRIIFCVILLAGSMIGTSYLADLADRKIGQRIQEPEVRQAEQLLVWVFCIMVYAIFLYYSSFLELAQKKAGIAWYLIGVIVLIAGLTGVWLVRTREQLGEFYRKIAWTERNRRKYIKYMKRMAAVGIPVLALLFGLFAAFSSVFANMMWLMLSDILLVTGVFLLPEIAAAADYVEETFDDADIY